MKKNDQIVIHLIQASIWGTQIKSIIEQNVFDEMNKHAITALPAYILSSLNMPEELLKNWIKSLLQHFSCYTQYMHNQATLPISVPYVILKGTSASQYYPYPELRTMGDIDIITKREDYITACEMLLNSGYVEVSSHAGNEENRHRTFSKNGAIVEIHSYFAMLNDPQTTAYLDDLIIKNIDLSHTLPDLINGLVILEHINQHMEDGLGLRQIIDWMMFVDKCLPNEKWLEFNELVENTGLKKLAIVITRMCEIYLGLPERIWCSNVDKALCEQLMEYILSSGNFGNKRTSDEDISENVFAYARTLKAAYKLLQTQGLINWKAAKNHTTLRPFAWVYQFFRYISRGIKREKATTKIKNEYHEGKKRADLFAALGVKTTAKGFAVYKNGKYVKE